MDFNGGSSQGGQDSNEGYSEYSELGGRSQKLSAYDRFCCLFSCCCGRRSAENQQRPAIEHAGIDGDGGEASSRSAFHTQAPGQGGRGGDGNSEYEGAAPAGGLGV